MILSFWKGECFRWLSGLIFGVCGVIVCSAYPPRPLPQQENRNDCLPTIHFQTAKFCSFQGGYLTQESPPTKKPGRYQRGLSRSGDAKFERFTDRFLQRDVETFHGWMWAEHSWIIPIHLWEDEGLEPEKLGPPLKGRWKSKWTKPWFLQVLLLIFRDVNWVVSNFLSNPSVKKRRVDVPIIPSARIPHTGCQKIQVLGRGSKHLLNFHPLLLGGDGILLGGDGILLNGCGKTTKLATYFFECEEQLNTFLCWFHKKDKSLVVQFSGCRIDYWIGNTFQALVIF